MGLLERMVSCAMPETSGDALNRWTQMDSDLSSEGFSQQLAEDVRSSAGCGRLEVKSPAPDLSSLVANLQALSRVSQDVRAVACTAWA